MGNIVLLDELTINKIAAGEVIERPASVIKEMVENSIDAGAKNVTVEIKNGGISFIRITDNGKGIAKDDMELAFERHATSKIRSSDDLDTVKSMGFRGEALASIAAISNVELVSKTENDEIGNRILVEGGDILALDEIGCSKGTTITVRNLFFNTPVRYKFLKKDFTESGYIEDVITRIALIHPEISIKFINSGKTIIQTNGNGDIAGVIYSIFGKDIANNIINVEYEYEYIKVKGVIGKPNIARSNRSNQIFYVNQRYIKDKTLSSAVEQAYKGMLPIGKFAFLILDIQMSPSKVDVNVHPAKLEVRFAEEGVVFKAMYHAIKDTLLKSGLTSNREKVQEIKEASKDAFKIQNIEEKANDTYTVSSSPMDSNDDVLEKLKKLQENLKKEVEHNPSITLTDKYKQMQEKYHKIIEPVVNQNKTQEANKEEDSQEKVETIENKEENIKSNLEEQSILFTPEEKEEFTPQNQEEVEQPITENAEIQEPNIISDSEQNTNDNEEIQESNEQLKNEETQEQNNELKNEEAQPTETNQEQQTENMQDVKEEIISFEQMYKQLFGKEPYGGRKQKDEPENKQQNDFYTIDTQIEDSNISMFENTEDYKTKNYKFIGIAFNTYIILEIDKDLYIMDQHAAHERIMYEKVKKSFFNDAQKSSQLLLLPDIITLTHKEMDIAKDNFALFRQAGFVLEEFGENTVKISGVPEVLIDLDTQELFKETLDEINTVARTAKQEKEEKFIATIACKAAVKANMKLTKEEVDALMQKLLELPNPFTCPHGRPTVIKMSKYEIERKFARK